MLSLGSIPLRIASAIAILVLTPAWNPLLRSGSSQVRKSATNPPIAPNSTNSSKAPTAANRLAGAYGKLPISFEVNQGQTDGSVQFLARGAGYTLFLTPGDAVLSLHASLPNAVKTGNPASTRARYSSAAKLASTTPPSIVRLQLIGANTAAQAKGVDPLPGKSNYFIGNDPKKWHTDVPNYAKVRYHDVYPGIDLLYYGNQEGKVEHDFVVSPGADPNAIAIALGDSAPSAPDNNGDLTLRTGNGDLTLRAPIAYQTIGSQRKIVPATYVLAAYNQVKFQLGNYDKAAPLVIDPVLQYSAVFGGSSDEFITGIAVDGSGNAYIAGTTNSTDLPLVNPLQGHSSVQAGFVSKINPAGTELLYSTYLSAVYPTGIAVDTGGHAYITGIADAGLPVKNAHQPTLGGKQDASLTVFGPTGNTLVYSTYLGGPNEDEPWGIAIDSSRNAYITGNTQGSFPTLHSVLPDAPAFIAKFNSAGILQYSSVFEGDPNAGPSAIAVDGSGSAFVTGFTANSHFQPSKNAFQSTCTDGCGFVVKLSPSGFSEVYATYLGGSVVSGVTQYTFPAAIAVDSSGSVFVAGSTGSGLPVTTGAFQKNYGGGNRDGFITKLNSSGSAIVYSTYLGGSQLDVITGLALDQNRTVYVSGITVSPNFPLKAPVQAYAAGRIAQKFVTTLSSTLSSIAYYSTYLGASGTDKPVGIGLDKALNVYLAGTTENGDVPHTPGALYKPGKVGDAFVSKLIIADDLALGISGSSGSTTHGGNFTYTIAVTSKGPDFGVNVHIDDTLPAGTTFVSDSAGGGTCTAPAVGATGTLHCTLPQLNKGQTYTVKLTVKVNSASGTTLSNTATTASSMQDFVTSNNKGTVTTKVL